MFLKTNNSLIMRYSLFTLLLFSCFLSFSQVDVLTITDLCEDDDTFTVAPITPYNPNTGYCGVAIFLITPDDVSTSTVDFYLHPFPGALLFFFEPL